MKYKDFYKQLIEEGYKDCVMAEVPPTEVNDTESVPVLMRIYSLIEELPDDIVYVEGDDHGKEKWPHVTILYGLEDGNSDKAKAIISNYKKPIKATLGKISKFENDKYDVLKIDVTSKDLSALNSQLKKLSHENKYPDYKAHVTLAYVQKGEGDDLVGLDDFDGIEIEIDKIIYADENRNHVRILESFFGGTGGGYGGAAGGSIAATGWAGTFNGGSSQNLNKYASGTSGTRYSPMNGNTVMGSAPYENVTDEDLYYPGLDKDEIFTGLRYEMRRQLNPNKNLAKELVVNNLKQDPKYYSSLHVGMQDMQKKVTYEECITQIDSIIKDLTAQRNSSSVAINEKASEMIKQGINERKAGRSIDSITSIMKNMSTKGNT